MPDQVEQRGDLRLRRRVALAELAGRGQSLHPLGGQHPTGRPRPVLVDLAGELHEVARGVRARARRVPAVGEQAVQRVPELVEHGDDVVPRDRRRGGRVVAVVGHHGEGAVARRLVDEVAHPRAALLRRAGPEVHGEQADDRAFRVAHLVALRARRVADQVLARVEGEAVQLLGGGVDGGEHAVDLEVLGQVGLVEGEALAAHDRLDVGPVRGGELRARVQLRVSGAELRGLLAGLGQRGLCQRDEHLEDGVGGLGAAGLGDDLRVVRVAQQRGAFGAGAGRLEQRGAGVEVAAQRARGGGLEQPTAHARVGELRRERLLRGVDQLDPVPVVGLQRLALLVRQPAELRLSDGDGAGVAGLAVQPLEGAGQLGEAAVELAQSGLACVVERDARAAEGAQGLVERVLVLLVEGDLAGVGAAAQLLEAGEEALVEVDRVLVLGEARRHLLLDGLDLRGGVRGVDGEEGVRGAQQRRTGVLPRAEHVLDGGGSRVVAEGGQGCQLAGHALLERRPIVGGRRGGEVRQLKGQSPRQHRVVRHGSSSWW